MNAKMRTKLIKRREELKTELKEVENMLGNFQFGATYKGWEIEIWRYGKGFSYRRRRDGQGNNQWRYCCDSWLTAKEAAAAAKAEVDNG